MRVESAIKDAFFKLKKKRINSALLDSEILMSKAINKNREFIILNLQQELNRDDFMLFICSFS